MSDQSVPLIAAKHPIKTQLEAGKTFSGAAVAARPRSLFVTDRIAAPI